jgi:hypothetical protein
MKRISCVALALICGASLFALDVEKDIVREAEKYLGCAYLTGGTKPSKFDCSGFVGYIIKPYVPSLPRVSRDMSKAGKKIGKDELLPGDLVFFATTPISGMVSHVALYIGQNSVIHSISDGPNRGVTVSSLDARYWNQHFHSAVRVLPEIATPKTEPAVVKTEAPVTYAKGTYTGELKNGEPDGKGTLKLNNGDVYTGEFKKGSIEGTGTYTWKNGEQYKGSFKSGKTSAGKETYLLAKDSDWETWNGYVMGDYEIWKAQQEKDFEAFNNQYDAGKDQSDFDAWKKSQGE